MTTPTRKEIIEAHNALNRLYQHLLHDKDTDVIALNTAIKAIVRLLPPKPKPTMADVEWDNDKHYLAEAVHPGLGKVIMLGNSPVDGLIRVARDEENIDLWQATESELLTLTGKRYTLTETTND